MTEHSDDIGTDTIETTNWSKRRSAMMVLLRNSKKKETRINKTYIRKMAKELCKKLRNNAHTGCAREIEAMMENQ